MQGKMNTSDSRFEEITKPKYPISIHDRYEGRQMRMRIVGYYVHGNKGYVAFNENEERPDMFKITDGFHDRQINERNVGKYKGYRQVQQKDINLQRIIGRMRGTRPWHPLLSVLKEASK